MYSKCVAFQIHEKKKLRKARKVVTLCLDRSRHVVTARLKSSVAYNHVQIVDAKLTNQIARFTQVGQQSILGRVVEYQLNKNHITPNKFLYEQTKTKLHYFTLFVIIAQRGVYQLLMMGLCACFYVIASFQTKKVVQF